MTPVTELEGCSKDFRKNGDQSLYKNQISVKMIISRRVLFYLTRILGKGFIREINPDYVHCDKIEFVDPYWLKEKPYLYKIWTDSVVNTSDRYRKMLEGGSTAYEASYVLNDSVKMEIEMLSTLYGWKEIFRKAFKEKNIEIDKIMTNLYIQFNNLIPCIFIDRAIARRCQHSDISKLA